MTLKIIRGEFARFLLAGAANTLLTYLLYLFLLEFLAYLLAYSITFCTGIALSYFLNVYFVFKQRASFSSFVKFPIVYIIQYSLGAAILWLLVDMAGVSPAIAMIGVIAATIPVTFLASRFVLTK
ncbi:MAG: GtrA family protein [Nitrosomonadales bacterium]|nr:GtrA family protein [Nitrosomonadales bacterium]